jgi:hypothetical protein
MCLVLPALASWDASAMKMARLVLFFFVMIQRYLIWSKSAYANTPSLSYVIR